MMDLLSKFEAGELIGLVAVAGGLLCGILCGTTAILTAYWHRNRKAEIIAALKHEMLERGMSAEDIRTVIDAGSKGSRKSLVRQLCGQD
jgi:hypothetical protein